VGRRPPLLVLLDVVFSSSFPDALQPPTIFFEGPTSAPFIVLVTASYSGRFQNSAPKRDGVMFSSFSEFNARSLTS